VEADGSAYFRAPSGVALFFQALDARGMAVQTMRSATHVQPGQTLSCTGCHVPRNNTPPLSAPPLASLREPSRITPGPEGSWPLRFDRLVQPILQAQCVRCHNPKSEDAQAAKFDLTPARAYDSLIRCGKPSLNDLVLSAYRDGFSTEGNNPASRSVVLSRLTDAAGHYGVKLDHCGLDRFVVWMDTYAQRQGSFSEDQEKRLEELWTRIAGMLVPPLK
jgi:cytochrome c553